MSVLSGVGNSEDQLSLRARAASFSINDIGLISVAPPKGISSSLMANLCKIVAAQAIEQVISVSPLGLVVRGIYPDYDLLDAQGARLRYREWQQPTMIDNNNGPPQTWTVNNDTVSVYTTGLSSRFDLKVYLFYGLEDISLQDRCNVDSILLKRGNIRLIDIIDTSNIHTRKIIFIQQPILYKAGDDANIQFHLKNDAVGKYDQIKIHGLIAEQLGATTITG